MLFRSLKTKMTLAVFLLVGFLMSVTAVTSVLYFERKFKQNISLQQSALLASLATQIDERIFDFMLELDNLADSITPQTFGDPVKAQRMLDAQKRERAFFNNSLFLFSGSGRLVAATPRELNFIGKDFSFRDYFQQAVQTGRIHISAPFASVQKQSHPIIMFSIPVHGPDQRIIGVLGGSIDLRDQQYLRSLASLKLGQKGFLSLYDTQRNVLMHPDRQRVLKKDPPGTNDMVDRALAGFEGTAESTTRAGLPVLRSVKRLNSTSWILAVSYPLSEAYAPLHAARNYFLAGSLSAALLSLFIVWPFMGYLTRPLLSFTRHLERLPNLAEGAQRLAPVQSNDEIGQMAQTFNRMILELEQRESALQGQKDFYLTLFENFPTMIWRAGTDAKVDYFNKTWLEFTGRPMHEELGDGWADGVHPEDLQRCLGTYREAFDQERPFQMEYRLRHRDGEYRFVLNMGRPFYGLDGDFAGYIGTCYDVTAKVRTEEQRLALEHQLTQSQKMEAIGTLTGGIAHDFNNILTAIVGYTTMMQLELDQGHPLQRKIGEILRASERASNLTRSLLAYSSKQAGNTVPVGLNAIVDNVETLLKRLIPESIELRLQLARVDLPVLADSGQIEQVLMNLVVNARDAMEGGGTLQIATEQMLLDQEFVSAHGYGSHGSYALLTVADSGAGMDEKTRDRIFEPFFTTKDPGKGTGLGLAMVYAIVKQHGGFINCYSEPGHGTVFRIYLPVIDAPAVGEEAPAEQEVRGGDETILLVEDDGAIREMIGELLRNFGYRVITAVDGEDAVQKFREAGDAVQLVLMDVIMPKLNGKEAGDAISRLSCDVKVLFMSGYTADIITESLIKGDPRHFVSKPVKIGELLGKIRDLLDE